MYQYKAKLIKIVDGDTIDAAVDVGFGITVSQRFRIDDFDAPETFRPTCDAERLHGLKAKERITELLSCDYFIIESSKVPGIYGRYGAKITLPDGRILKDVMISEGLTKLKIYM